MIPIKLILENFVSHIYSVLDFTQFDAALIMGSFEGDPNIANGVGKSTIMDGIRFALYGKGKFSVKTKMIRRGTESCKVEFEFIVDGESYKIVRSLSAKTASMNLELSKKVNGEWEPEGWTCDTPTKTNQKIVDIIGMNHDTFVNIVYFRQNDVSGFTSATVSKRKEILKEALQIGIWDEFQKVSKDTEKNLSNKLEAIEDRLKLLGDVESEIKEVNKKIKEKSKEIKNLQQEVSEIEGVLGEYEDEISHLEVAIAKDNVLDKDAVETEMRAISQRAKEINDRKDVLKSNVKDNNDRLCNADRDCKNLEQVLINYYRDVLVVPHRRRAEIENEFRRATKKEVPTPKYNESALKTIQTKRDTCVSNIQMIESDLAKLNALEPGKECPTCLSKIENPKSVENRRQARRKFLENRLLEEKALLGEVHEELEKINKAINKADIAIVEIERTNLIIAKRMAESTEAEKDNQRIQSELKSLAAEWNKLKDRKLILTKLLEKKETENKQNLKKLIKSRQEVIAKLDTLKEEALKFSVIQGNMSGFREELERRNSEVQALISEKNSISDSMAVYSKLSTAFGKDGIQAIIMENITEDLRQYANSILRNIYYKPMSVDFVTQRQTGTGTWREDFDIIINIDNELYDFEDISGGEQVRISIALRLALSQLLMRRVGSNVRFLLFDEVDQSLDKHGLEALSEAIAELSKEFKILVISHSDYMKEKFEHIITVHMGPTGSVLR